MHKIWNGFAPNLYSTCSDCRWFISDGGETPSGGDLLCSESTLLGEAEGVRLAVGDTEVGGAGRATRRDVENCSNAVVRTQWFVYRFDSFAAAK